MAKKPARILAYSLSHRGLVRENNEDSVRTVHLPPAQGNPAFLAVLADGVGGHHAGEVASRIAVETIISEASRTYPADNVHSQLEQAILAANQAILDDAARHVEHAGMGTTCVCALIIGHTLYAAHLGDSRLYLLRKRKLQRLTRDHTMLEELITLAGADSDGNPRAHPMAHVLTRYLGASQPPDVDQHIMNGNALLTTLKLRANDVLLLCSDGISDLVSDDEIGDILATCSGRKRAQSLVYRALENGGHDNASVIVLQIP